MSSRIRTYTEEAQSEDIRSIKSAINAARTVVILGFGYHKQNISILSHDGANSLRHIFMTTYTIPNENHAEIQNVVQSSMKSVFNPRNYTHAAYGFMVNLRPSLVIATS
jgi:hypothetical protein